MGELQQSEQFATLQQSEQFVTSMESQGADVLNHIVGAGFALLHAVAHLGPTGGLL